jgi:hypothetical protein
MRSTRTFRLCRAADRHMLSSRAFRMKRAALLRFLGCAHASFLLRFREARRHWQIRFVGQTSVRIKLYE